MKSCDKELLQAPAQPLTAGQTAVGAMIVAALTMGFIWVWMVTI